MRDNRAGSTQTDSPRVVPVTRPQTSRGVEAAVEERAILALDEWRAKRDPLAVEAALASLAADAASGANLMEASLACARAGVTTGEWAGTLRNVFGEYRAPTGVSGAVGSGERVGLAEVRAADRLLASTPLASSGRLTEIVPAARTILVAHDGTVAGDDTLLVVVVVGDVGLLFVPPQAAATTATAERTAARMMARVMGGSPAG